MTLKFAVSRNRPSVPYGTNLFDQSSSLINSIYCASGTKRARQFDFMAMFEKTRKTAIERSQPVLGNYCMFTIRTLLFITVLFYLDSLIAVKCQLNGVSQCNVQL